MGFQLVKTPEALKRKDKEEFGVKIHNLKGLKLMTSQKVPLGLFATLSKLNVTTLERTLVDVMDRPKYSGSWEEKWRSLETVEFFNLDEVVEYAKHLGNATTTAKVGFYLEQHREELMVPDEIIDRTWEEGL